MYEHSRWIYQALSSYLQTIMRYGKVNEIGVIEMKKFVLLGFTIASMAASPLIITVPAQAQAVLQTCSSDVSALVSQSLAGAALDAAVRGLATSIVTDSQAGTLAQVAASDCLKNLAALDISAELRASLNGIVIALNSGEELPALAASQA